MFEYMGMVRGTSFRIRIRAYSAQDARYQTARAYQVKTKFAYNLADILYNVSVQKVRFEVF